MRFSEIYSPGKTVLSLEFFPPKQPENLPQTLEMISGLAELKPDFMTITYGALGRTQQLTLEMARFVQHELGIPAVFHLTCMRHSRAEVDQILDRLEQEEILNVLALRGDPPQDATEQLPRVDGIRNARDLTRHIAARCSRIRSQAQPGKLAGDPSTDRATGSTFSIAVAGYPETHKDATSPAADLDYLKEKVDAGAELVVTQLFFDPEIYFRFVERAQRIGISVPIVPGVMPIANLEQIKRFTSMCNASIPKELEAQLTEVRADPQAVAALGVEYATQQCERLLAGGAPGIHLYTLNRSVQARPLLQRLSELRR